MILIRNGYTDFIYRFALLSSFLGAMKLNEGLYIICLFKRRIIARDKLEHALYIIPVHKYQEVSYVNYLYLCHGVSCLYLTDFFLYCRYSPKLKGMKHLFVMGQNFLWGKKTNPCSNVNFIDN